MVDDDAQGSADEVLAQLAAAQFELLGEDEEPAEPHPEVHLTLIPAARAPQHTAGVPAPKKRSSHTQCPPGCAAGHSGVLRWLPQSASRD
ncbi:hypothetical protein U5640_36185 [Streptomyces sp. SS7]|uniref:hypothetical protein n=1 Tax=Streptomyces sp. SS7 TaxID=3108485 RepID=UPI0030EF2F0B